MTTVRRGVEPGVAREWIGGWRLAPFYLLEPFVYRPEIAVWYDAEHDKILDMWIEGPDEPALGTRLNQLLQERVPPGEESPRIRVQTRYEAEDVAARVSSAIEIVSAATPEIDRLVRLYAADHPAPPPEPPSYLANGRIAEALARDFLQALASLREVWPESFSFEGHPFRFEAAAFGYDSGVLAPYFRDADPPLTGFVIFLCLDDYLNVRDEAVASAGTGRAVDVADVLRVSFAPAEDVPEAMRREAARLGWSVAGVYPVVTRRDADGLVAPQAGADVLLAAVAASLLGEYLDRSAAAIASFTQPACHISVGAGEERVRLIYPYVEEPRPERVEREPSGPRLGLMQILQPPARKAVPGKRGKKRGRKKKR